MNEKSSPCDPALATQPSCKYSVIGIDVGGPQKGFHAVALRDGVYVNRFASAESDAMAAWCGRQNASIIAIDAPCKWSKAGKSRRAERELKIGERTIQCFKTPTFEHAQLNKAGFYDWVFNGQKLYAALIRQASYTLFGGTRKTSAVVFETFPHAIVCALAGRHVSAKPKSTIRRKWLTAAGCDDRDLPNIDFVDAALCAVTAARFLTEDYKTFGDTDEGFIVVPGTTCGLRG